MAFRLSNKSLKKLEGLHPDLVKVIKRAIEISKIDFTVLEGVRTIERQKKMVASGASQTMNSRHLTGHAVDIAPLKSGVVSWDWPLYHELAKAVKQAAKDVGVTVEWGGDWKKFKDGPHWQLPFSKYPKTAVQKAAQPLSVTNAEPITNETDTQAATQAVTVGGGAVASGTSIGLDPLVRGVEILSSQQGELSSGDYFRIGIAVVIIIAGIYFAWKKIK